MRLRRLAGLLEAMTDAFPDWLEVTFTGSKTIDEVALIYFFPFNCVG